MVIMGYGVPVVVPRRVSIRAGQPQASSSAAWDFVAVVEQVGHDVGPVESMTVLVVGVYVGEGRGAAG
jgi:hypothetical protein